MYNERNAHTARKVIYAFFLLFFLVVIVAFYKVVVDHLGADGYANIDGQSGKLEEKACEDAQTRASLEEAGLENYAPTKCKD